MWGGGWGCHIAAPQGNALWPVKALDLVLARRPVGRGIKREGGMLWGIPPLPPGKDESIQALGQAPISPHRSWCSTVTRSLTSRAWGAQKCRSGCIANINILAVACFNIESQYYYISIISIQRK